MLFDAFISPANVLKHLWRKTNLGSLEFRSRYDFVHKPQYAWGLLSAAKIAKALGYKSFSVIEFGVAYGEGLVQLEKLIIAIKREYQLDVKCFGFDSGQGLPKPASYKDLPYLWTEGDFNGSQAHFENLKKKLRFSEIILGDVKTTIPSFIKNFDSSSPLGFISFDLDLYSSTRDSFSIFSLKDECMLPRIPLYFDDISSSDHGYFNAFTGELLAIDEFNDKSQLNKVCPIHGFQLGRKISSTWNAGAYCFHRFNHPLYCEKIV